MAWRIHDQITHGEIDNRQIGHVQGRIWIAGSDSPIELQLKGNCWSDLAGCLLKFRNPNPDLNGGPLLNPDQKGVVGDMTASRKVRVPTVDSETLTELLQNKKPIPTELGNCIYLEWFSEANGRVVVEAAHYQCELSAPEWTMTSGEEEAQRRENAENLQDFLQDLVNQQSFLDQTDEEEDEPLDEFQWEQLLRQSEEITDQYLETLEKYRDEPDSERLIAEEMGWDWLIEEDDLPEENPLFDFVKDAAIGDPDELDQEDHPLANRLEELADEIIEICESRGLIDKHENLLKPLVTSICTANANTTSGLAIFSSDENPDYGFIIATLKRTLTPLHQAIAAIEKIEKKLPEEADWIEPAREELFLIREEILALMQTFRNRLDS